MKIQQKQKINVKIYKTTQQVKKELQRCIYRERWENINITRKGTFINRFIKLKF